MVTFLLESFWLLLLTACIPVEAFLNLVPPPLSSPFALLPRCTNYKSIGQFASRDTPDNLVLSNPEQQIYVILEEIHSSNFPFRVVVIGDGAILESTATFPKIKLNRSPQSGENLVTLSSNDQSFEFHVKTVKVSKVSFSQRESNGKILRIIRFMTGDMSNTPMFSLILANDSQQAADWYQAMLDKYGNDFRLK